MFKGPWSDELSSSTAYNIKSKVLSSLLFEVNSSVQRCFYNYKYHEIPQAQYWFTLD